MDITDKLIFTTLQLALEAGKAILDIYRTPFEIEYKTDHSPITLADQKAHVIISQGLSSTALPLLSEEGFHADYETRKNWEYYWLVDPLDGTKEFVRRNGEFTVNIALIHKQMPVFGVVYAPVPGLLYWGSPGGSYRLNVGQHYTGNMNYNDLKTFAEHLPIQEQRENFIVLGSKSHMNTETIEYINKLREAHPNLTFSSHGSSLKFCILAEGNADIYPRFGPTMEWDTAAGHAVAYFAGCYVIQQANQEPLVYNKPDLLNPDFIAGQKK